MRERENERKGGRERTRDIEQEGERKWMGVRTKEGLTDTLAGTFLLTLRA